MENKKIPLQFLRQPKYYKGFSCIGGSCPISCCLVWRVDWRNAEVEKLRNADCSPELKELAEKCFIKNPSNDNMAIITMTDKFRCPFLTEDNFCRIQRELGEEYLSYVCRKYPRQGRVCGNYGYNYCNLSCYKIMDTLCEESDCMVLENKPIRNERELNFSSDTQLNLINNPELKYHGKIFEFFYDIISDSSHSLETSVILGATAAKGLSKFIDKNMTDKIPDQLESMKAQLNNAEQIGKLEALSPNYKVKLGFSALLFDVIIKSDLIESLGDHGKISVEKYIDGENKFKEAFKDRPFALRNIALNFLLELNIPFRKTDYDIYDNYAYFVSVLALVKLIAAAAYEKGDEPEKTFKSMTSYISRSYAHNEFYFSVILDLYWKMKFNSPAYIAALIR